MCKHVCKIQGKMSVRGELCVKVCKIQGNIVCARRELCVRVRKIQCKTVCIRGENVCVVVCECVETMCKSVYVCKSVQETVCMCERVCMCVFVGTGNLTQHCILSSTNNKHPHWTPLNILPVSPNRKWQSAGPLLGWAQGGS